MAVRPIRPDVGTPPARKPGPTPEDLARTSLAKRGVNPGQKPVTMTVTVSLSRGRAEVLTARAIREGRNVGSVVAEIREKAEG
jgi:hypothetical protein